MADALDVDPVLRLSSFRRKVDRLVSAQVGGGKGILAGGEGGERSGEHQGAAIPAASRPEVDDMVGRPDHGLLVFDDDEGVSLVAEGAHDLEQFSDIALVEADARLVHDEEGVDQRCPEACCQVHALDLPAGERLRGAVEREVAEAHRLKITEARHDLSAQHSRSLVPGGKRQVAEQGSKARDGGRGDLRKCHRPPRQGKAEVEGLGLEAPPMAGLARLLGAVAAQEDADVHLVGLPLHPSEEPVDAVPTVAFPEFLARGIGTVLPGDDKPLV